MEHLCWCWIDKGSGKHLRSHLVLCCWLLFHEASDLEAILTSMHSSDDYDRANSSCSYCTPYLQYWKPALDSWDELYWKDCSSVFHCCFSHCYSGQFTLLEFHIACCQSMTRSLSSIALRCFPWSCWKWKIQQVHYLILTLRDLLISAHFVFLLLVRHILCLEMIAFDRLWVFLELHTLDSTSSATLSISQHFTTQLSNERYWVPSTCQKSSASAPNVNSVSVYAHNSSYFNSG